MTADGTVPAGQPVNPYDLVAALGRAGWTRAGGQEGGYVRMQWPDQVRNRDASLLIPLDPDISDYDDLMTAAMAELTFAATRGRLAARVVAEAGPLGEPGPVARLSRLMFEAREIVDMFRDLVEGRVGRQDEWSRRVIAEIDTYRASRGWSPDGFGGEQEEIPE